MTNHYEQLYANKLDSLEEISKLPESYDLPRMNKKEKISKQINNKKNESVPKISQERNVQDQIASLANFPKCLKNN